MAASAFPSAPGLPALNPPHASVWVRYLVKPSYANCRGVLRIISPDSAALLADERLAPGAVVLLELPGPEPGDVRLRLALVWSAEPSRCGRYLLRCRFTAASDHPAPAAAREGG